MQVAERPFVTHLIPIIKKPPKKQNFLDGIDEGHETDEDSVPQCEDVKSRKKTGKSLASLMDGTLAQDAADLTGVALSLITQYSRIKRTNFSASLVKMTESAETGISDFLEIYKEALDGLCQSYYLPESESNTELIETTALAVIQARKNQDAAANKLMEASALPSRINTSSEQLSKAADDYEVQEIFALSQQETQGIETSSEEWSKAVEALEEAQKIFELSEQETQDAEATLEGLNKHLKPHCEDCFAEFEKVVHVGIELNSLRQNAVKAHTTWLKNLKPDSLIKKKKKEKKEKKNSQKKSTEMPLSPKLALRQARLDKILKEKADKKEEEESDNPIPLSLPTSPASPTQTEEA